MDAPSDHTQENKKMHYDGKKKSKKLNSMEPKRLKSTLCKTDTFGTGTKCPSSRGVRLTESQIYGVKKGRDQL